MSLNDYYRLIYKIKDKGEKIMKKIFMIILFVVLSVGVLSAEEVNLKKVIVFPERYEDQIVEFNRIWIGSEVVKDMGYYRIPVYDSLGEYVPNTVGPSATAIVFDSILVEQWMDCVEEVTTGQAFKMRVNLAGFVKRSSPYNFWLVEIFRIEVLTYSGEVFEIFDKNK